MQMAQSTTRLSTVYNCGEFLLCCNQISMTRSRVFCQRGKHLKNIRRFSVSAPMLDTACPNYVRYFGFSHFIEKILDYWYSF